MRFLQYLNEEYLGMVKGIYDPSDSITYYVNPDSTDLKELYKLNGRVRFIADNKNEKLYVWNSDVANHYEGQEFLIKKKLINPKDGRVSYDSNFLNGIGSILGGKLHTKPADCHDFFLYPDKEEVKDKMKPSWSWLKPYFADLKFIKKLKNCVETGRIP